MKKVMIGVLTGYLLTSIFSIPALPASFWYFTGGAMIVFLATWLAWWRFNDDLHDGEF